MARGNCEFRGSGGQYFPTVFIHLFLLGTITLGLYAPWAWVRLLRLKASHTTVHGKGVTFIGTGGQLFLLGLVQGLLTFLTFGIYGPWALCKYFTWRAENTLVGEKPGQFNGTGGSLFLFYIVHLMVLPMITFGLYYFWGFYRLYAWKEEHTDYGGEKTSFGAGFGGFVKVSLISWILNAITLNLYTPWSLCMLYRWQLNGLAVGDEESVDHFPPVKTNMAVVAALIVISLLPVLAIGVYVRSQYDKLVGGSMNLARVMEMQMQMQNGGQRAMPHAPPTFPQSALTPMSSPADKKPQPLDLHQELRLGKLNDLILQDGKNAGAFFTRAVIHASRGNLAEAEKDYTQVIALDGGNVDAHYNRGLLYTRMEKYDLAIEDFNAALEMGPRTVDVYCNRGNVNHIVGKSDLAIEDYNEALKMNPNDGDLYYNRAVVYLSQGEEAKAMEDFQKAAQLGQEKAVEYLGQPPARSEATEELAWRMDLQGVKIPETAGKGKIHGEGFTVEQARIENGILSLREGKDFFADRELVIFLFLNQGESPEGKTYRITRESGFGSPHIHMKWREKSKELPETEIFMKEYAMILDFERVEGSLLPGRIYLSLPDETKSFVAGTFLAEVK